MQVRQIKSCRVPFSFRISNAVYHITAFQVVSIICYPIFHSLSNVLQLYSAASPVLKAYTGANLF